MTLFYFQKLKDHNFTETKVSFYEKTVSYDNGEKHNALVGSEKE